MRKDREGLGITAVPAISRTSLDRLVSSAALGSVRANPVSITKRLPGESPASLSTSRQRP